MERCRGWVDKRPPVGRIQEDASAGDGNDTWTAAPAGASSASGDNDIDMAECLLVMLRHKRLIMLGSLVPTLIGAAFLYFLPMDYSIRYTYRMDTGEADLAVLEEVFYSSENISRLIEKFEGAGLGRHARGLAAAQRMEDSREFVSFEVSPRFFERKARTLEELLQRQTAKSPLLLLNVRNRSTQSLRAIAGVYRENFEQVAPLYRERSRVIADTAELKNSMAAIEESRYLLTLQLERKKSTLEKLKNAAAAEPEKGSGGEVVLQFDVGAGGATYLPLSYQIQSVQTQIINLEEDIRTNVEKYAYYSDLLWMWEAVLAYLDSSEGRDFTVCDFLSFLGAMSDGDAADKPHVRDQLAAQIKRIENVTAAARPVTVTPTIDAASRGILKKTALVFVFCLVLAVSSAFLREDLLRKALPV